MDISAVVIGFALLLPATADAEEVGTVRVATGTSTNRPESEDDCVARIAQERRRYRMASALEERRRVNRLRIESGRLWAVEEVGALKLLQGCAGKGASLPRPPSGRHEGPVEDCADELALERRRQQASDWARECGPGPEADSADGSKKSQLAESAALASCLGEGMNPPDPSGGDGAGEGCLEETMAARESKPGQRLP